MRFRLRDETCIYLWVQEVQGEAGIVVYHLIQQHTHLGLYCRTCIVEQCTVFLEWIHFELWFWRFTSYLSHHSIYLLLDSECKCCICSYLLCRCLSSPLSRLLC